MLLAFNTAVIAVIVFLLLYMILMPIISICLDKKDYSDLKNEKYTIGDDLIRKVSSRKKLPFEVVLYKKKQYQALINIQRLSFC